MFNKTTCSPPGNISIPCDIYESDMKFASYAYVVSLASSIIIAILSPMAVVGNTLILAAIWKKTFYRTSFHVLLSGLAVTDLCTGLIAQPFNAAATLLHLPNRREGIDRPLLVVILKTVSEASATYFISITLFIITIMSVERWLHMSRRSLVILRHGHVTAVALLLVPIPLAVFRSFDSINGTFGSEVNIIVMSGMLMCFLTSSFAYFKVFQIIRRHQQQIQGNTPPTSFAQSAINFAKYKRSVITILYILILFCLCFLPFVASIGVQVHKGYDSQVEVIVKVSLVLLFLSSSLNPCLYLWRMNDVRNGVKQLICSDS